MNRFYHQLQTLRRFMEDADTEETFADKIADWCVKMLRSDVFLLQYGDQSVRCFAESGEPRDPVEEKELLLPLLRNDRYEENIDLTAYGWKEGKGVANLFFPLYAYRRHVGGLFFCRACGDCSAEE